MKLSERLEALRSNWSAQLDTDEYDTLTASIAALRAVEDAVTVTLEQYGSALRVRSFRADNYTTGQRVRLVAVEGEGGSNVS